MTSDLDLALRLVADLQRAARDATRLASQLEATSDGRLAEKLKGARREAERIARQLLADVIA